MNSIFITLAAICTVSVLWWMIKSEKGATSFAVSALQGIAAIFAVNWYTIATAVLLGLPGVITTLALNLLLL